MLPATAKAWDSYPEDAIIKGKRRYSNESAFSTRSLRYFLVVPGFLVIMMQYLTASCLYRPLVVSSRIGCWGQPRGTGINLSELADMNTGGNDAANGDVLPNRLKRVDFFSQSNVVVYLRPECTVSLVRSRCTMEELSNRRASA